MIKIGKQAYNMKNRKYKGFTFVEVLIIMIILATASVFMITLMGSSLMHQKSNVKLAENVFKSGSKMEDAIQTALAFLGMPNDDSLVGKKPQGYSIAYSKPGTIKLPDKFQIGEVEISDIDVYAVAADSENVAVSDPSIFKADSLAKGYVFSYIAKGYSQPRVGKVEKAYMDGRNSDNPLRFVYMNNGDNNNINIKGKYVLNKKDVSDNVIAAARFNVYKNTAFPNESNSVLPTFTDMKTEDTVKSIRDYAISPIKLSTKDNLPENNDVSYSIEKNAQNRLNFADTDVFFNVQTLNNNGFTGPLVYSEAQQKESYGLPVVHIIGLPYTLRLLNHNDSLIKVRRNFNGTKDDRRGAWYDVSVADSQNLVKTLNGEVEFEIVGDKEFIHWQDVRNYIGYERGGNPAPDNYKPDSGFDFYSPEALINNDNVVPMMQYKKDDVFTSKTPEEGGSLFMKFELNKKDNDGNLIKLGKENSGTSNVPYILFSYRMEPNGDISKDANENPPSKGSFGCMVFVDSKNKMYLFGRVTDGIKPTPLNPVYEDYLYMDEITAEMQGVSDYEKNLYAKVLNPYSLSKTNEKLTEKRKYTSIVGITFGGERGFSVSFVKNRNTPDDPKNPYNILNDRFYYTTTFNSHETECKFNAGNYIKIGGVPNLPPLWYKSDHKAGVTGAEPPDFAVVTEKVNPDVLYSDLLFYGCNLINTKLDRTEGTDPKEAKLVPNVIMDYLYRKSLNESEKSSYDTAQYVNHFK